MKGRLDSLWALFMNAGRCGHLQGGCWEMGPEIIFTDASREHKSGQDQKPSPS